MLICEYCYKKLKLHHDDIDDGLVGYCDICGVHDDLARWIYPDCLKCNRILSVGDIGLDYVRQCSLCVDKIESKIIKLRNWI